VGRGGGPGGAVCALDHFNAECHAHLGVIYVRQQERDKALEQLGLAERYCVEGPYGLNTWEVLSDTYRLLGEKSKAIDAYRQLVDLGRRLGINPS